MPHDRRLQHRFLAAVSAPKVFGAVALEAYELLASWRVDGLSKPTPCLEVRTKVSSFILLAAVSTLKVFSTVALQANRVLLED